MRNSEEYRQLLDLFFDLVESQAGKNILPGEEWLNDAQTLSVKLFHHLVAMDVISTGSTIEHSKKPSLFFIDHASVKVVARAALETYLVFYYLFGSNNRTLSKFRHNTWVLGGLTDRQSSHVTNDEHRAVLADEKRKIEELKVVIQESENFKSFTTKQKEQLLNRLLILSPPQAALIR